MAHDSIRVTNITVLDNPAQFKDPFKFEITFECVEQFDTGKSMEVNKYFYRT